MGRRSRHCRASARAQLTEIATAYLSAPRPPRRAPRGRRSAAALRVAGRACSRRRARRGGSVRKPLLSFDLESAWLLRAGPVNVSLRRRHPNVRAMPTATTATPARRTDACAASATMPVSASRRPVSQAVAGDRRKPALRPVEAMPTAAAADSAHRARAARACRARRPRVDASPGWEGPVAETSSHRRPCARPGSSAVRSCPTSPVAVKTPVAFRCSAPAAPRPRIVASPAETARARRAECASAAPVWERPELLDASDHSPVA